MFDNENYQNNITNKNYCKCCERFRKIPKLNHKVRTRFPISARIFCYCLRKQKKVESPKEDFDLLDII